MKAKVTQLEISENATNGLFESNKSIKFNSKMTLIFTIIFFLNVFALIDIGTIITDTQFIYLNYLYPLSFIGNLICSFFSIKLMHKISTKGNLIITLMIMLLFLLLTIISKMYWNNNEYYSYIILISKVVISLMQASIWIFSIQWCQYFSTEHFRLCIINTLQLTPIIGIIIGYIIELYFKVSYI